MIPSPNYISFTCDIKCQWFIHLYHCCSVCWIYNYLWGIVVGYQLKYYTKLDDLVWFMVFNATFNNISVISCQSVLLVEETWGQGEKILLSCTFHSVWLFFSPLSTVSMFVYFLCSLAHQFANCITHPIRFKSYPWVSQILLSCTSPGVRPYISTSKTGLFSNISP
jgi:hypothetical protein